jgi:hypothetical protein
MNIKLDTLGSSKQLTHKYSGRESKLFWEMVNAMGDRRDEFYSLGVVLQNLEDWVLAQMKLAAPNFVEDRGNDEH